MIVEDNPHGIAAARASGAHVMIVQDPNEVTWDRITAQIQFAEQGGIPR
jgi:beta-phosphoglucomutase-like phosphatase (HAD superfamily)